MKICVMTDLEGVSGVVSFEDQAHPTGRYYEQARSLLTAEVNAAVEAMLEEQVTDILVIDGHGPGAILFDQLHPAAQLLHGRPFPWSRLNGMIEQYDATIMIGQHAMAGVEDGNLNHTQSESAIEYYKLNDKYIGEIAQYALYCGALDIPLIFLSGDSAACREAQDLINGIVTAAVKQGLSRTAAVSCSQPTAHRRISQGVTQALIKHRATPTQPLKWPSPFILEKRFTCPTIVERYAKSSLHKRIDPKTVQLQSDNILDIIYL